MAEAFLDLMDQYHITNFALICTSEFSVTTPVKNDTGSVCGSVQRTASLRDRDLKDRLLVVLVDSSSNTDQTEKTIANIQQFGATVISFAGATEVAVRIISTINSSHLGVKIITIVFPFLNSTTLQWTVDPYWTSMVSWVDA
ncbi:hypothetical protein RvY_08396 [Ramazzottius varieornatus]|uniref:Uncharacterized protein n=1 Tax=Ramazzottius varieornatus TaxID=947166 RepID=A0A1D1VDS6_RAMVA|nr:hypothetical protein RvY_08396 [Ramazzottius varieornatus]